MSTLSKKFGVSSVIPIITLITFLIVGCGSPSTTETPFAASETGDSFGGITSGTPRSTNKDSTSTTTSKTSTNSTASMSTSPSSNNSSSMPLLNQVIKRVIPRPLHRHKVKIRIHIFRTMIILSSAQNLYLQSVTRGKRIIMNH